MSNAADRTHPAAPAGESGTASAGGGYRMLALVLALIVTAALVYGLIQTAFRAAALFTG
ncbi:MAG: hypothetical protein MOP51_1536 [Citricoccus sp.]|nr:hypothetical protein [Citricoccus sp. WCRC_4]